MSIERGSDGRWTVRREFRRTVDTEAEAVRIDGLARNALDKVDADFHIGLSSCPTIREALPEYLKYKRIERANEPATLRVIKKRLERFAADLSRGAGDIAVDRILVTDLVEWRRRRLAEPGQVKGATISRAVVNHEVGALKAFANWCVMRGICRPDLEIFRIDWLIVKGRDGGRKIPKGMSISRFRLICKDLRERYPHIEIVLRAMALTGGRPAHIFALKWADIEWPRLQPGRIRFTALKGGVETEMPIENNSQMWLVCKEAAAITANAHRRLRHYGRVFTTSRGEAWTSGTFGHALQWAQAKMGIDNPITAYDVRHASMTWLAQAGMGQGAIQAFAKQKSVRSQDAYRHVSGRDAMRAYEYLDGIIEGRQKQRNGKESENGVDKVEAELELTADGISTCRNTPRVHEIDFAIKG